MNISCVILNYNDAETTTNLINEVCNFTIFNSIILVDNLSTDHSFEVLKMYANDKVKVIQSDRNGGYGYGNNYGIRYAYEKEKADYILVSNPDVHFTMDCVRVMADFLEENNDYAIVAPKALKRNGEEQQLIAWKLQKKWDYVLSASMVYLKLLSNKFYSSSYFEDKTSVDVDVVPGSLLMVNADYMVKYGMYDEGNFLYSEEETLALKFIEKKLKTRLLLTETYIHDHSVSISKSFPSEIKKKKMQLESRQYLLDHYYDSTKFEKSMINLYCKLALLENKIIFKMKNI